MHLVQVRNLDRPTVSPVLARYCATFFCQLRGLTFRRGLAADEGLLLVQGGDSRLHASIHMLGVFIDLGVVWIDNAGVVVDSCLARRWRPLYVPAKPARYILEMAPERMKDFAIGEKVSIERLVAA